MRNVLTKDTLVTLYNTLLKPYFTYCMPIWGNTCKSYLKPLEIMQKKMVRIITFSQFRSHSEPLFCQMKLMNIRNLYTYFSGIFIFKCLNHLSPNYFRTEFKYSYLTFKSHFAQRKLVKLRCITVALAFGINYHLKLNPLIKSIYSRNF